MENGKKAVPKRMVPVLGLVVLVLVGAGRLPAQDSVEARLAALEARIQELESELAAARGTAPVSATVPVNATNSNLQGAFIRPAVLTTPSSVAMASVAAAAPAAARPPQTDALSGELEGLNFFKGVKFGGFLDTYYVWDTNEPPSGLVGLRNFDFHHNSLTLSQVIFDATKAVTESSPLGYGLQLQFGPTANFVNTGDFGIGNSTAAHFLQYYLSGKLGKATFDFGKFVTQHGAEVIDTRADWNYSRSLLFAWAIPYYHFGVRATLPVNDKFTAAAYLVNGWNNVIDNNKGKTLGLQAVLNPTSRISFVQNYMVGKEQSVPSGVSSPVRHLFDSLLTIKLHDKVTFMVNYDYGMDRAFTSDDPSTPAVEVDTIGAHVHWQGIAAYLKLQPTPWFAFTPRYEYFDDRMGFQTLTPQRVRELTLTPEFTISNNLVTRFEYRHEWSSAPVYDVSDPTDDPTRLDTIGVGMILKF